MNVHQLRRWSDRAEGSLRSSSEAARNGANALYSTAMNHPTAATAVVLGTGVAAALLWLANRNGTFSSKRKQVLARVRSKPARSRKTARAATS